ncbi:MAG: alpha/beta hydrolase [Raineya sp.]|jgi:pimeloyl-ACP methyl ester carboxylesterase|nr:alpha/beta hydrolase [Raineya sp.]
MEILHHSVTGSGKPVVLIHGFCENETVWDGFVPTLAKNNQIISLDLGGFGKSSHLLPNSCSIEALAEQVKTLLDSLEIDKAIFIGHSLGGYVSLALAEKYSSLIEKICLFHSTALADTPEKKDTRNKVIDFVKKVGVERYIESFVSPLFYQPRLEELKNSILEVEKVGKTTSIETIINVVAAMRDRENRLDIVKNAKYPILYIIGKNDGAVTIESYQEQINCNSLIETLILEETGHMGMFERPQETLEALLLFCR